MDTRTKILDAAAAAGLNPPRPVLLVSGRFDILRAETAGELAEARRRTGARTVAVAVRPLEGERIPIQARARMAAAIRVVDYVFICPDEHLDGVANCLQPIETIHLEDAETGRVRQLTEHVRRA